MTRLTGKFDKFDRSGERRCVPPAPSGRFARTSHRSHRNRPDRRHVCRHVYTHVNTHVYRHVCMHVRRHVRRHACGHVPKHAHRHVCADVYMRTCVQTCVCRHVRAPMCAHLCTHMGTHGQACVRACVGRHVRTLVSEGHTYVGHEYIRTTSLGRTPLRDRGCTQPCMGRGMHVALHGPWGACSPAWAVGCM